VLSLVTGHGRAAPLIWLTVWKEEIATRTAAVLVNHYANSSNQTSKTRTHSMFRQGCMLYELIPNMPEHRLVPLMTTFAKTVSEARAFSGFFAYTI
jgi:alanine racemase